jgi:histone acetyltransferase MYST1
MEIYMEMEKMGEKTMVEIGEKRWVRWRDGQRQIAEIVEKRSCKKPSPALPSSSHVSPSPRDTVTVAVSAATAPSSSSSLSAPRSTDFEYYVHYPGFDRRLDEWITVDRIDLSAPVAEHDEPPLSSRLTKRPSKRKLDDLVTESASTTNKKDDVLSVLDREHDEITKVKNIQSIVLGKYEIDTWYFSPFPEEYCGEEKLYVCEFCLKYMKRKRTLFRHFEKCCATSPPGKEIYRDEGLTMYEIDGRTNKIYCQNLCLLSKLFLDHKTLYYDVDPFLFYVLCETDEFGSHIVGYFSKEKHSQENYNLACILTFPPYQRKGYGKFLISVSYELTKRETTTGSPEKPLSDLGKISYRSYWAYVILQYLQQCQTAQSKLTVLDIGKNTGIRTEDTLSTLHSLNLIKYWKGQHVISISPDIIQGLLEQARSIRLCRSDCLHWEPPERIKEPVGSTKKGGVSTHVA